MIIFRKQCNGTLWRSEAHIVKYTSIFGIVSWRIFAIGSAINIFNTKPAVSQKQAAWIFLHQILLAYLADYCQVSISVSSCIYFIRRNDRNANFKNKFYNCTELKLTLLTELWLDFMFACKQHIFTNTAIFPVIFVTGTVRLGIPRAVYVLLNIRLWAYRHWLWEYRIRR